LPHEFFKKLYIAKRASRDCIISHISTTLREVDALEKMKHALLEMTKYDRDQLAAADSELLRFKEEALARSSDVTNDVAFRHAVYADELAALAVTDTQLGYMTSAADPDSDESDSDMSDDLVYAVDDDSLGEDQAQSFP
jgi:hypothetical protein